MHTRVGASYVANAGCPQLVAASLRQYELVAVQLARRRATFDALRARLARALDLAVELEEPARAHEPDRVVLEPLSGQLEFSNPVSCLYHFLKATIFFADPRCGTTL